MEFVIFFVLAAIIAIPAYIRIYSYDRDISDYRAENSTLRDIVLTQTRDHGKRIFNLEREQARQNAMFTQNIERLASPDRIAVQFDKLSEGDHFLIDLDDQALHLKILTTNSNALRLHDMVDVSFEDTRLVYPREINATVPQTVEVIQ